MKNIKTIPIFMFILMLTFSCSKQHSVMDQTSVSLSSYSPVYPILTGKSNNPVYRLKIHVNTTKANVPLSQVEINLSGTSKLSIIDKVVVYYTAFQEDFSDLNEIGETKDISERTTVETRLSLKNGDHYIWISLTLKDHIDLDNTIQISVDKATVGGNNIVNNTEEERASKSLGYAIRQHMDDGVHTYRIPGLATTNNGTLIAVYDVRYNSSVDLQEDVDVGMNRSTDGGQTWESMKIIMDISEYGGLPQNQNGVGDPAVLVDRLTNTIWVAGLWAHGHPGKRSWWASQQGLEPKFTNQFLLVKSEDDGVTWSDPINITSQIKNPNWYLLLQGPGKGITMDDGTLVFPAQFKDQSQVPYATIIYSKDRGETWSIGTGAKSKTTEAQVVELSDHSLMLNMRDDRGGARSIATTSDLGASWIEHPTSRIALPEPVCMASLIKHAHQGDEMLLFANPFDQKIRYNMTIKVSMDDGSSWNEKYFTLIDEGKGRGYSCMTSIGEDYIGILYEGSQSDLIFQRIPVKNLLKMQ